MVHPISVDDIAEAVELTVDNLYLRARRAERDHRPVPVKIGRKTRLLRIPQPSLKAIQHRLYRRVIRRVPISACAHCCPGRGVISNAKAHLGRAFVSIRDLKDCFPSISATTVRSALQTAGFNADAASLVTRLCTAANELPQGPPTSPGLLNIVLKGLDEEIEQLAVGNGLVYTRYADDLTLSGDSPLSHTLREIEAAVRRRGYRINASKRRDWGPRMRPTVTGIVLATTLNPETEFLTALTGILQRMEQQGLDIDEDSVAGKISWVESLDPALGAQLRTRFSRLLRQRSRRRA